MRWVVDSVEEGQAAIEVDGRSLLHVPLAQLPAGVREGDVLSVSVSATDEGTRWEIRRDEQATVAARAASTAQSPAPPSSGPPRDPGGNIRL